MLNGAGITQEKKYIIKAHQRILTRTVAVVVPISYMILLLCGVQAVLTDIDKACAFIIPFG